MNVFMMIPQTSRFRLKLFVGLLILLSITFIYFYKRNMEAIQIDKEMMYIFERNQKNEMKCANEDFLREDLYIYRGSFAKTDQFYNLNNSPQFNMLVKPGDTEVANLAEPFEPQLTANNLAQIDKLLILWLKIMKEVDVNSNCFLMSGGTLLGSYRHHDYIPWDDDVDLLANIDCIPKVLEKLKEHQPNVTYWKNSQKMKLFGSIDNVTTFKASIYNWGWPYLDISFFTTNRTHFCEIPYTYGRYYHYKITMIFPLMLRPFRNFWLPAPVDTEAYLTETYPKFEDGTCAMGGYSHILEGGGRSGSVSCKSLRHKYPFVTRTKREKIENSSVHQNMTWVMETLYRVDARDQTPVLYHSLCLPVIFKN